MKITHLLLLSTMTSLLSLTASANPTYRGRCAKQADAVASRMMAHLLKSSPVDYVTISSLVTHSPNTYEVEFSLYDGNQESGAKYQVVFENLEECRQTHTKQIAL